MPRTVKPLRVLVIGGGMYVAGIGTSGFGTILPSLIECCRKGLVDHVQVVGRDLKNKDALLGKANELKELMGVGCSVGYEPSEKDNETQYLQEAKSGQYDCAIVSTPDHLHFEMTKGLIEQGLHCLVVKPLVPKLSQADQLIRLQYEKEVYCAVEFHKRFDETNLSIKKMIGENKIGDLLYILVEFSQRRSIPLERFRSWAAQTNIFQYLGVHYIDLISFFSNALPERVMAIGQKNELIKHGIDTYDSIQVMVEWKTHDSNSFTSALLTNWIDPLNTSAMSDQKIKLIGTLGRIECDQKRRGLALVSEDSGVADINPYFSDFRQSLEDENLMVFDGYGNKSIYQFIMDCSQIQAGEIIPSDLGGLRATFFQARISTAVIEAANESLRNDGAWTTINQKLGVDPRLNG